MRALMALLLLAACAKTSSKPEVFQDLPVPGPDAIVQCDINVQETPPDPTRSRFALTLLHFNIQYVAGGLSYLDEAGVEHAMYREASSWDEKRVEDFIVTETFEPVLDLYLAHPTWGADIELGSYMIEVLAERHPAVLEKLRTLAMRGQIEVISFHYSDQLFLAFPRHDMERSIAMTKDLFRKHCLPLGGAVFDQEGQAGEGRQDLLLGEGYTVGIYPVNLFKHQHGEQKRWPYYEWRGGTMVVGPGEVDPASGIEVTWLFFDDGELLALSGSANPYVAPTAKRSDADLEEFAAKVAAAEQAGFFVTTVSDYVRHLKARGVPQPEPPALLDGTWQPKDTRGIFRWLGGRGPLFGADERDNVVRTGNAQAHTELVLAETLRDHAAAKGVDVGDVNAILAQGFRHLLFAEVSDATGINPWEGEVRYGIAHNQAALAAALDAIARLKSALKTPWVAIDAATGQVQYLNEKPVDEAPPELDAPLFDVQVQAETRTVKVRWLKDKVADAVIEVSLSAGKPAFENDPTPCLVEVAIRRNEDRIIYSPGLLDNEVVSYGFEEFSWPDGELFLPLGNGLIGLGGGLFVVKDQKTIHLAARLAPSDQFIRFRDETLPAEAATVFRFGVVKGDAEKALKLANTWNVRPSGVR